MGPELTLDGSVARIDLGRPDESNKLTRAMMAQLAELISSAAHRQETTVITIECSGPVFCGGRDGRGETVKGLSGYDVRTQQMKPVLDVYSALRNAPIPVVACVHGDAIGFGAALAGACDITVASSSANFAFPEISHGIAPTMAISAVRNRIPEALLSYLIFTGERIDAVQAQQCGLIGKVFDAQDYARHTHTMIEELSSKPRRILETIKKYMNESAQMSPSSASDYAGALLALLKV